MILQTISRIPFWQKVLTGFILGALVGVLLGESATVLKPLGDLFISAIKMLVAPLVFCAIVVSITSLGSQTNLKRLSLKTLGMFMLTGTIASLIGLAVGSLIDMGGTMQLATTEVRERNIPGFAQVLLDMIPVNPFASLAEGKVLQIIVFAALVGIAINKVGEKAEPLKRTIEAGAEVMFQLTRMVLKLTPIGVFGLMAWVVGEYGLSTLLPLGKFIAAIYIAALIHMIFVYGGFVKFAGLSPMQFFRKAMPAQLVAFSTSSSFGTLPASADLWHSTRYFRLCDDCRHRHGCLCRYCWRARQRNGDVNSDLRCDWVTARRYCLYRRNRPYYRYDPHRDERNWRYDDCRCDW